MNSYTQQWSFNHKGSLEWFLALRPPPIRRPASFREPWCVSTANMKETLHKSATISGGRRNQQHRSQNRHSGPTQRLKEQPQPREKVQQVNLSWKTALKVGGFGQSGQLYKSWVRGSQQCGANKENVEGAGGTELILLRKFELSVNFPRLLESC